ncbi:hypothetical protein D3C78_1488710 [compost metagenome]
MNAPERLQALLRELGQRMGLSQLPLDADGGCALELDQLQQAGARTESAEELPVRMAMADTMAMLLRSRV